MSGHQKLKSVAISLDIDLHRHEYKHGNLTDDTVVEWINALIEELSEIKTTLITESEQQLADKVRQLLEENAELREKMAEKDFENNELQQSFEGVIKVEDELRETLAAAEKERDTWRKKKDFESSVIKIVEEERDELRQKLLAAEKERDGNENAACWLADTLNKAFAELDRLKSSGQWAVTRPGLTNAQAENISQGLNTPTHIKDWRAVRLSDVKGD